MNKSVSIFTLGLLLTESIAAAGMVFPGKDWAETSPESQGLNSQKLAVAIEYLKENSGASGVRELVMVRRGRLVWKGDNIDHRHGIWSGTKSFTSTVLGLLIEDGRCKLDTRACNVLPEMQARYPEVTLRHFTTMTSGYRAIGDEPQGGYKHGPSHTPFQPNPKPLFVPPGSQYAYWDSAMNQFANILTHIAGEPLEEVFRRRIAKPIGMNPKAWDWGDYATVNGIVVNGGSGNGNKHIFITARELARFGHLFLNQGNWNGQQLISADWVKAACSVQVHAQLPWAQPESEIDGRGCYGFNWWRNDLTASGKSKWPGAPADTFAASGYNNNKLFIIPSWQLVIVRLGLDQSDGKITDRVWGTFLEQVGNSMQ